MKHKPLILMLIRNLSLIALIWLNFYLFQINWLSFILGSIFLFIYAIKLGRLIFPNFNNFLQKLFGLTTLLSGFITIYWLSFYLYKITDLLFGASLLLVALAIEMFNLSYQHPTKQNLEILPKTTKSSYFLMCFYSLFILADFYLLIKRSTVNAIPSPWILLSYKFWLVFAIATVILIIILRRNSNHHCSLALLMAHFFLMSSVAFFIYRLGYGFDPFLHYAGEKLILETGTLTPKPPYYIGAYSLIIFLKQLLGLPLDLINRLLLPLAFSLTIPPTIFYSLVHLKTKTNTALLTTLCATFLPLTFFINTTPQGLTNLLAVLIVWLGFLVSQKNLSPLYLIFLSLITCFIHPFYGLPLFLFSLYLFLTATNITTWLKKIGQAILILISAFIFPISFYANSILSNQKVSLNFNFASENFIKLKTQYFFIWDSLYTFGFNYYLIFFVLALFGLILIIKNKQFQSYKNHLWFALIFLFNYWFVKLFLSLDFTTNKNAGDFTGRILELSCYFCLPFFVYFFIRLLDKYFVAPKLYLEKTFLTILILSLTLSSLYFSYPVFDNYLHSKNWNLRQADLDTVKLIEKNSNGEKYIVLANQMLAAAVIRDYGFKHYYNGEFYYAIPSSNANSLNVYFQDIMDNGPTKELVETAMRATSVNQAYLVIPNYWNGYEKLNAAAKIIADSSYTIDNKNFIFYFENK